MSWRIVSVASHSKLDYKMDYLVVRNRSGSIRIHLSEISILMLESTAISLTAYLLRELERRKIDVIFCDETRTPYGMLSSLYGSHDTSLCYKKQVSWSDETKAALWAVIVKQKIRGQAACLPSDRIEEKRLLESYLPQVLPGDASNREGHAAKVFFNAMFGKGFSRDADCPVNSALNYGYSLLLSAAARDICACGYCTQLGIFHDNRFNRLNLACDLMEPFRPFVDAAVRDLAPKCFGHDEKVAVLSVLNRQITIEGKKQFFLNALRLSVRSALESLSAGSAQTMVFPSYEEL